MTGTCLMEDIPFHLLGISPGGCIDSIWLVSLLLYQTGLIHRRRPEMASNLPSRRLASL